MENHGHPLGSYKPNKFARARPHPHLRVTDEKRGLEGTGSCWERTPLATVWDVLVAPYTCFRFEENLRTRGMNGVLTSSEEERPVRAGQLA